MSKVEFPQVLNRVVPFFKGENASQAVYKDHGEEPSLLERIIPYLAGERAENTIRNRIIARATFELATEVAAGIGKDQDPVQARKFARKETQFDNIWVRNHRDNMQVVDSARRILDRTLVKKETSRYLELKSYPA